MHLLSVIAVNVTIRHLLQKNLDSLGYTFVTGSMGLTIISLT